MGVIHILKDGTQVDSIRGHVVRMADAEPLYHMIHSINNGTARLIKTAVTGDHTSPKGEAHGT